MNFKKYTGKLYVVMLLAALMIGGQDATAQRAKNKKIDEDKNTERNLLQAEIIFLEGEKYFMIEDYAKALIFFQKAHELNPTNAAIHYKVAQTLIANQDLPMALESAKMALELGPENKYYHLINAEIYSKLSKFKEAAGIYENLITSLAGNDQYLFDLAALYLYAGDYDNAINTYNRAQEKYGISKELVYSKQRIYLKQNKLEEAILEGQTLTQTFPGEPEYLISLSEIYITNNREQEAIPYLKQLLEHHPDHAKAQLMLAEIFQNSGEEEKYQENLESAFSNPNLNITSKLKVMVDFMEKLPDQAAEEKAKNLANRILEAHPNDANAYAVYGDLYLNLSQFKDKSYNQHNAIDMYRKAVQLDESNFGIWQNVLQIEAELYEIDSLKVHSDQALEVFPNQPAFYYYHGFAQLSQKNYSEAVAALEQGKKISNDPNLKVTFSSLLGDAYQGAGDHEKSDASYEEVIEADPNNYQVLNNYSYFLSLRKEKLDKARKMSGKVIKANPDDPTYLDTYAWILYMQGNYKEAKKYLELAIEKEAGGTIIEHYGDVLFKLGDIDGAVKQWNRAKGMDDTSDLIDKKIADRKLYE